MSNYETLFRKYQKNVLLNKLDVERKSETNIINVI